MHIAYILPSLRNLGPIVVAKNISDYLIEWGHVVDVYYFDEYSSVMNFKCPTIHISMKDFIDFDKYDIIHSHCMRPDIYVEKWKKHIHKAKIVSTLHQDTFRSFCYQYNSVLSYLFTKYWCWKQSKFDGVVSISNQLKDAYKNTIKAPMTTIYNGCSINIDTSLSDEIVAILNKLRSIYKIIGTYAYVTRRKGLQQVIKVLPGLHDYAFVIIGEGPDIETLKQQAQLLGVSNRVLFFPYQKNPCNYLPYFDIYAMTSYSEGFGLAMVEAALGKRAIVCSDIPSFHEIFADNEVCFFVLDSVKSLQMAIVEAFNNRKQYGTLAYEKAKSKFTTQKMAENHLKYYQNILK